MSQPKQYWNEANARAWESEMRMDKPKVWWILFRRWEVVVRETKESILDAYPNPVNPEVNLVKTVEYSAYQKAVDALKRIEQYYCACSIDDEIIPQVEARTVLQDLGELDAPGKGE